ERVDEFELGLRDRARLGQTAIEFPCLTFRKSAHHRECKGACRRRQTAAQSRDLFTDRRSGSYVFGRATEPHLRRSPFLRARAVAAPQPGLAQVSSADG